MTRDELIKATLRAMSEAPDCDSSGSMEGHNTDNYDAIVIATLSERLPDGQIKTCDDLALSVECCTNCHTFYPHYDMCLEILPDGAAAWICCAVRSALLSPQPYPKERQRELMELEEALGGNPNSRQFENLADSDTQPEDA